MCGDVRIVRFAVSHQGSCVPDTGSLTWTQREHSANIIDSPKSYSQQSPAKPLNIITLDCRGLEFVEFKPDVSFHHAAIVLRLS